MTSPPPSRRPPYWLVPVFVVLLLSPPAWAAIALAGAAIATLIADGARDAHRRRSGGRGATSVEGTRLGVDRAGREVVLHDRELSAHGLIVGASGAGKSTTLLTILTDHIRRGRPVLALDMKGSPAFATELAAAAAASGRRFRVWTLDGPSVWNPLQHGNATELKDKLIATERFTEPHYQRAAERYVQAAIQALKEAYPDRSPTLDDVVELMDPGRLGGLARHLPADRGERLHDYLAGLTPDQHSAVRGLGTRLALITESSAGAFLSPRAAAAAAGAAGAGSVDPIDLRSALEGDEVVLFSLNSSTYGQLAAQIGTLVVQDLTAAAGSRLASGGPAEPERQAIVGVDEFSALGADNVLHLLARGREAGLPVLVATQEMADLDRAGRGFRDQVLGIVGLKIAHRQDVPESALTIAKLGGTVKAWEETRQVGSGLLGGLDTGRGTRRLVDQFRVDPNEVKELKIGDAVVISKLPRTSVRTVHVAPPRHERDGPELG